MKLYFLRHGEAGERTGVGDDSQRPLTPQGIERMATEAQTLQRWGVPLDLLLSSPYRRARQTADAIAAVYGVQVIEERRLSAGCERDIAGILVRESSDAKHLWLVGHEPDFSRMIELATGGLVEMKKGSLACLHVDQIRPLMATLEWLVTADQMVG